MGARLNETPLRHLRRTTQDRAGKVLCRRTCRDAPSGSGTARPNEVPANACGRFADRFRRRCFGPAPSTPCGAHAPIERRSRRTLRGGAYCACRKSDSAILMMKATKDRLGCDGPDALNRPMERGVLVQRAMNARFIIISGKLVQDPAQVRLPEHDHVVETFPSECRSVSRRTGSATAIGVRSACPECLWRAT